MSWLGSIWGWVSIAWIWLDFHSKSIGALASIVFGVSSAVLAYLAYRANKRNNWGETPVIWVPTLGGGKGEEGEHHTFRGEVWNRHKYSIFPRLIWVKYRSIDTSALLEKNDVFRGDWLLLSDGWWVKQCEGELKTLEKIEFSGSLPAGRQTDLFELPSAKVDYFDPALGEFQMAHQWRKRRWRFWKWYGPMKMRRIFAVRRRAREAQRVPK